MNETVLVRFGELALKSEPVRKEFKKTLIQNIKRILGEIPHKIETERGRIFVKTSQAKEVASRVAKVPGVVSSSPAQETAATMEDICKLATKIAQESFPEKGSFAVRARRVGEHKFSSQDIAEKVGSEILENKPNLTVNLDSPDHEIHIEVRDEKSYLFTEAVDGIGGLPVGTQGKAVALFSGGTNALASSFLMLKRGVQIFPLFLNPSPEKDQLKNRIINASRKLLRIHPVIELQEISFSPILEEITAEIPQDLRNVVCRRMKLELAEGVAERIGGKAVISDLTQEQIKLEGLQKVRTVEAKTSLPVLKPLLGFDQAAIQKTAEKITNSDTPGKKFDPCPRDSGKVEEINLEEIRKMEKNIPQDVINSSLESLSTHRLER